MTAARWSPADLNQQRLVVRQLALRAESNRRRLVAARRGFSGRLRELASSPWVLGGCFALGWLLVRPPPRRGDRTIASRLSHRLQRVGASLLWLTRLYRQFQSGIAAGAALTLAAPPRAAADAAVPVGRYEEI
jgi:hypothetical protein